MSSPYLISGESITMTTHRVDVDAIPYDVMLTTQRLTLIDSRYARFEPLMIAFEDILTVKSGTASPGDPVIILSYIGADDIPREMNLIFSQQPGEHRKRERDIWVKKLMEAIIAGREDQEKTEEDPAAGPDGLQPSIRRWVAPEGIALHTPSAAKETDQPEITIVPDEEDHLFRQPQKKEPGDVPEVFQNPGEDDKPGEYNSDISPENKRPERTEYDYGEAFEEEEGGGTPSPLPEQGGLQKFQTIVIPFVPATAPDNRELPTQGLIPEEPEKIPGDTILAAVHSLMPKKPAGKEQGEEQQIGSVFSPSAARPGTVEPDADEKHISTTAEPVREESTGAPGDPKAAVADSGKKTKSRKKSRKRAAPAGESTKGGKGVTEPPAVQQGSDRKDPHQAAAPLPGSRPGIVTIILVLVVLIALAVGILLILNYSQGSNGASQGQAAVHAVTSRTTPVPATPIIPADSTGFRVIYPGDFAGEVGIPGSMKILSGTGDVYFPVQKNNRLVQASIQKQDNSGDTLTIEVYAYGKMIYTKSVSTPGGSLDILIDTTTGSIAGMTPTKPAGVQTTQSKPLYF
ncbi:hypothetical protein [uncultured Methanoregula sp.]|uniref:hypothetical protein n=1 Tax=uncultured Methanoregula sp. TaxID=1005933 RepID=UPI002AAC30BF|nr:hypothetical protein [uncultured Methanoregula sp.]